MSITFVDGTSADLTVGNPTSAINSTGANLIIGGASWFNAQPGFTDSKGNSYTFIRNDSFFGIANLDSYYKFNPTVGANHTFTPTTNNGALSAAAFSGVDVSGTYDQAVGTTVTSTTTIQSGALTPSAINSLVVALLYFESGTASIDSGFTLIDQSVGGSGTAIAYLIQTSAISSNPTWTLSTSNTRMDAQLFTFLPAASGSIDQLDWKRKKDFSIDLNYKYDIINTR